jgi:putative flippase GtrA
MKALSLAPSDTRAWVSMPTGRKVLRYTVVSMVTVVVSQAVLFLSFGVLQLASAVPCNIIAAAVATLPSYYLNRRWAWGITGRSHPWREIVPFWGLAFLGLVLSILAVDLAEKAAPHVTSSHLGTAVIVNVSALAAWGVIWIGKFVIFNHVLFIDHGSHRHGRLAAPSRHSPESASTKGLNTQPDPAWLRRERSWTSRGASGCRSSSRRRQPAPAGPGRS